jgi:hypothetical protein
MTDRKADANRLPGTLLGRLLRRVHWAVAIGVGPTVVAAAGLGYGAVVGVRGSRAAEGGVPVTSPTVCRGRLRKCSGNRVVFSWRRADGRYPVTGRPRSRPPAGRRNRWAGGTAVAMVLLLGMAAGGCTARHDRHPPARATQPSAGGMLTSHEATVVALLADNELLAVAADRAVALARLHLGPAPNLLGVSHAMALATDKTTLYVLVPRGADQPGAPDRLVVFDLATRQVRATYPLEAATSYRSLALGPHSHQVYLFGNHHEPGGQSALVAVLDPAAGQIRHRWMVRPANGRTWLIYRGIVTDDERHLVVSYHGPDTTGADVLTVAGNRLVPCASATPPWGGCLDSVHGDVIAVGDRLLATTGDAQRVEERTLGGKLLGRWDSGLAGNHLMELAADAAARRLYVIGSCGYAGGLSVIDLDAGLMRRLAAPVAGGGLAGAPPAICGERIETGPTGLLVVARTGRPVPVPESPGALLLIDAHDGRLLHTVPTPSEPVDLLVVP